MEDMKNETYIEMNEQYERGLCLDDYNDQISVCSVHKGSDGQLYLDWAYPQGKERKPAEKSLPWQIRLGDINKAIKTLHTLANKLEAYSKEEEPTENKKPDIKDNDIAF